MGKEMSIIFITCFGRFFIDIKTKFAILLKGAQNTSITQRYVTASSWLLFCLKYGKTDHVYTPLVCLSCLYNEFTSMVGSAANTTPEGEICPPTV